MKISVIIPTYKPQEYLWECLDSLAAQTFPKEEFEVLVILNGCCQPYKQQIEKYLSSVDPSLNIKLIHTDKGGVSNARNIGLDLSQGEYIAFIDDDDFVSATYLESLHKKIHENTVVLARPHIFNDGDLTPLPYRSVNLFRQLSKDGRQSLIKARKLMHITCIKLIPRDVIGERRYDPSFSVGEDTLMMFLLSDRISNVDFASDDAVYYRRVRSGGAVDKFRSSKICQRAKNSFRLILKYTSIYFSAPLRYSFFFYLTRVWGALHSIVKI